MLEQLKHSAGRLGKPSWRAMLRYMAELHERNTNAPRGPLAEPWEGLGPGYVYAPAFGHWDIVHAAIDTMHDEPAHAAAQLRCNLATQTGEGQLPHIVWWRPDCRVELKCSHPPIWPAAAEMLWRQTGDAAFLRAAYAALERQIEWFGANRRAGGGYYYVDMIRRDFESGVDLGARFDELHSRPAACVDATAHVYWMHDHAARWAAALGLAAPADRNLREADELRRYICEALFDEATGLFHDSWAVGNPARRTLAYEGIWPVVVGAASQAQAGRVMDLLADEKHFMAAHPITTVSRSDPKCELRMWRGPAWNSMTWWAACACERYSRRELARTLLERALDDTAAQFDRTGTIWEFYHPEGGRPEDIKRKPNRDYPSRDYVGHNPLIAMARLWDRLG